MNHQRDEIKYGRIEDIPPEIPIPLTQVADHNGRYSDHGEGMYCSHEGKNSARRGRNELWAIRHKTREDLPGPVWFYCLDHLPSREWNAGDDGRSLRVNEITCSDCFLVVTIGTICEETGRVHTSEDRSD